MPFLVLAAASGVLWFVACADFDIWPLAWIAMVPSLFAIERAPTRKLAVMCGWLTGVIANLGGFYWIVGLLTRFGHLPTALGILGLVLLALYQGTVFLLFAAAITKIRAVSRERFGRPLPMVLIAPVVMVAFEMIVPFIFPWYLAITQAWITPVIQIAELFGPVGVTALLMVVNGAIYDGITEKRWRARIIPAIAAAVAVAMTLGFGYWRIGQVNAARAKAPKATIGLVQGNIPFNEKGINHPELAAEQLRGLQQVSARLEQKGADLIVWTESSYPYAVARQQTHDFPLSSRARIRRGFSAPLILGAVTFNAEDRSEYPYNSALMLASDGHFTARFDKMFLLIFGEYIPFVDTFPALKKILPSTTGQFSRGAGVVEFPFEHDGQTYRLGPMICYEDIVPDFGRKLAAFHPHLIVNITNDAWFGDTSEPWEHLALSVYRAVEMRADMVRAVNTGVSTFIDATGKVYDETYAIDPQIHPRGADGLLNEVALVAGGYTFYARHGDVLGYGCVVLALLLWLVWPRLRRRRAQPQP